jgi:hypothetical protein
MTDITLSDDAIRSLMSAGYGAEVRDSHGQVVGFFYPNLAAAELENFDCPYSKEELNQREAVAGGRSLSEILDDLRKIQ